MNLLLVGFNQSWAEALTNIKDVQVFVIEEPDLWKRKNISLNTYSNIVEVKHFEYQLVKELRPEILNYARSIHADVVIPGLEYAVETATKIAETLHLPNLGTHAARILTNKYLLRSHLKNTEIPQPRFRQIKDVNDIYDFYDGPLVIKPTNRQASAGVVKVYDKNKIEWAWDQTCSADEGIHVADRDMEWEYMVEDLLYGSEVSTEALVKDGQIYFFNITCKETLDGNFPVEVGHYVPGDLPKSVHDTLYNYIEILINELHVDTGILHAEWIIVDNIPHLIECAGRAPGDYIFQLVKKAYEFCPYTAMFQLVTQKNAEINRIASKGAAIVFLYSNQYGILQSIKGVEQLKNDKEVLMMSMFIKEGDQIGEVKSSWDRLGCVICEGETGRSALDKAKTKKEKIEFIV